LEAIKRRDCGLWKIKQITQDIISLRDKQIYTNAATNNNK